MSMSQEEIEALMNGLDIGDDEPEEQEVSQKVNTDEIELLLSQKDDIKDEVVKSNEKDDMDFDLDELISSAQSDKDSSDIVDDDEINRLLNEIGANDSKDDFKAAEISFHEDDELDIEEEKEQLSQNNLDENELVKCWTSSKINEGKIPLPAEKDTKVVNQLSQVANDSEEKVSQIFDVLSLTLDNNSSLRKQIKEIEEFTNKQSNLLNSLSIKFPSINVFNEHLQNAQDVNEKLKSLKANLDDEDNHIFQAMELMQFNDINRQKIERVMSVIRKLSLYLNNLFEDDNSHQEVAVARHIHGDETSDLIGDDLDKLIAEFNKEK